MPWPIYGEWRIFNHSWLCFAASQTTANVFCNRIILLNSFLSQSHQRSKCTIYRAKSTIENNRNSFVSYTHGWLVGLIHSFLWQLSLFFVLRHPDVHKEQAIRCLIAQRIYERIKSFNSIVKLIIVGCWIGDYVTSTTTTTTVSWNWSCHCPVRRCTCLSFCVRHLFASLLLLSMLSHFRCVIVRFAVDRPKIQ